MPSVCSRFLYGLRVNSVPTLTQNDGVPVKEYLRMFTVYLTGIGIPPFSEFARQQFIYGLSAENKVEVWATFNTLPLIKDVVGYLTEVEIFKRIIFNIS